MPAAGDDLFDAVLAEEERHIAAGHAAGVSAGRVTGEAEGRALGAQAGFDVGAEVGYYYGAATTWLALAAQQPQLVSDRAQRGAAALRDAAAGFDVTSPLAEGWTDALEALRAKFKATAAQVGVTQSFCLARGGPPGMMATSAASGDPTAPPEGRVVASGGDRQREGGALDMSF